MAAKIRKQLQTTFGERLSYGVFGVGLNIFFVLTQYFLQQYYLINAAVPASMVAVVFLLVKVWDAINDPLFGVVVDKARLKSGKFLPWIRISAIFLPVTAAALFFVPLGISPMGKAVFLLIAYILFDAAATMTEVPANAVTTAMTSDPEERSQLISTAKLIGMIFALVVLVVPTLYEAIGWHATVLIFSGIALLTMLPACFMVKERNIADRTEKTSFKEIVTYIKGNKYLLIFFASAIIYGICNTAGGVSNLFAIYNLGGDDAIMPLLVVATLPGLAAIVAVKALLKRFDKFHMQLAALACTFVVSILMYFTGYSNTGLLYLWVGLRGFSMGMHTMLFFLFAPDCAEYGAFKTGTHAEGAAFSIQSFASKAINALAGTVALFMLAGFGFLEGSATQTDDVKWGLWFLVSVFPAFGALVQGIILALFYKLRDKDVLVMSRANSGEIAREDALKQLKINAKGREFS
ncbi:sodium:galactoside symporter [Clostridia bacterium]|nr:sodium:galactoside symporter [Clostridia bacterium]